MHLLAAKPGGFSDDEGIIDLQQSPGEMVILSSQDTSLGLLASVAERLPETYPAVRLANLINLIKPSAYDLYEQAVIRHSRLVIVSVLGGMNYWRYGMERLVSMSKNRPLELIMVPGDDQPDEELFSLSTCGAEMCLRVWRYLREGGSQNITHFYHCIVSHYFAAFLSDEAHWLEPRALPAFQIIGKQGESLTLNEWRQSAHPGRPTVLLLFYRAHIQSGNMAAFVEYISILRKKFDVLAVAVRSLKDPECLEMVNALLIETDCDIVINTTSFSQHTEGNAALSSLPQMESGGLFEKAVPVIQAIMAANSVEDWREKPQGLRARDITMNVALPEYDGRIISRAVSFKALVERAEKTQIDIIRYQLHAERAAFVAELSYRWAVLRHKPNDQKRVALVLANYPTKDGRIGNGVGLDTPASTINILRAMQRRGYAVSGLPEDGDALIRQLLSGLTNDSDTLAIKPCFQSLTREDYQAHFEMLPPENQQAVIKKWGAIENDPKYRQGSIMIAGIRLGQVFVGIQPARGFNIDLAANYHDPVLVPCHAYLAFYFWLRHVYAADAIAHIGKHGNLEWLPGKSVALSDTCWPDIALGPLPHLYPFIVNDPGEGAQAKRRAQAVILDHLVPPMARAESYGALQELENLVDEFYQALGVDRRRENYLRERILALIQETHLEKELKAGQDETTSEEALLNEVDTYLCELKEAQIRNGLHRFGAHPEGTTLSETMVSLTRFPRGEAANDAGILHCLCQDLDLKNGGTDFFDPLRFDPAQPWQGKRPERLERLDGASWRTEADTRERLEKLAEQMINTLLEDGCLPDSMPYTAQLLRHIQRTVVVAVKRCGENEINHFMQALEGQFVPAGPSGAPTRGRLDVLPTGRNFYSLDCRAIPTQSAWALGWQSAEQLIQKHMQEKGDYLRQIGLSVWGTSTMRTGGDDIAQAMALMGVRPIWAEGSNRVVDVEIIPGLQLGRPRVDVTLRISGFFRDAFPNVVKLFDVAVQALADYEEPGGLNTIRQHIDSQREVLISRGCPVEQAQTQSRFRVFGSKPGCYGAGLQRLIDERIWNNGSDLAKAYVNWGGYAYHQDAAEPAFEAFENRLSQLEAVVQNQDNREHDLLDSDDYYQFQGGMANAVRVLKGTFPSIYHGDHSDPSRPRMRTLREELNRVIRSRVLNPKWIAAMQRHGYKGAFEMAASVDYLFAYDATTELIEDYQYEAVTDALVLDEHNQAFLKKHNPNALKEMSEKLLEAQQRGLWNAPGEYNQLLIDAIVDIEDTLETASVH